jgi:hypothetical protein
VSEPEQGSQPAVVRTPDGSLVVDVKSGRGPGSDLRQVIADARAVGADAIWVSGFAVDTALGFERAGGYAHLEAPVPPRPMNPPSPPPALTRELQIACFAGVWAVTSLETPVPRRRSSGSTRAIAGSASARSTRRAGGSQAPACSGED